MDYTAYGDSQKEILEGTFDYLVKCGLENLRMRALCNHLGLAQNTLYYWFENKENLISEAAILGLKKVSDNIFNYVIETIDDVDGFIEYSLGKIDESKNALRCIYQLAASPVYGDRLRGYSHFTSVYDDYAKKLAQHIGCDYKKLQPLVYMFAACVLDYAIWEDELEVKVQLEFIKAYIKEQSKEK